MVCVRSKKIIWNFSALKQILIVNSFLSSSGFFVHTCSHCKWWSTRKAVGEKLCSQGYYGVVGFSQKSHKKIIIMENSPQHCISNRFERHLDLLLGVLLNRISRQTFWDSAITIAHTDNGVAGGQQQVLTPLMAQLLQVCPSQTQVISLSLLPLLSLPIPPLVSHSAWF